jgi:hypothetical protein
MNDSNAPMVLAYGLTAGLFAVILCLFFVTVPEPSQRLMDMLLGGLLVGCTGAWSFYHGSSQGSRMKDQKPPAPAPPQTPPAV